MAKQALSKYLKKTYKPSFYGTAGYRTKSEEMVNIMCRASVIAYIRSATFAGKYIGLYVTASHNPLEYNGIKFVDFNGNMLDEKWEKSSDELVNCDDNEFYTLINRIFRQLSNCSSYQDSIFGNVVIGRDTRPSGEKITEAIKEVLKEFRCKIHDYGVVSCPEMHYLIRKCNEKREIIPREEYIDHLHRNYVKLRELVGNNMRMGVDTANGVAYLKIKEMIEKEKDLGVEILNDPESGVLNLNCGADYIVTTKKMPKIRESTHSLSASFDGDMDRLIFYDGMRFYDGDAQCVFLAHYFEELVTKEKIKCRVGAVLSFYSNTGAVNYLKNKVDVVLAQTGVKNFVKEARAFDIGVYSEPNGHASVIFSKSLLETVSKLQTDSIIKPLTEMFDPSVGDALANMLVFKVLLQNVQDLIPYTEYFSRLLQVTVKDKTLVKVDRNYKLIDQTYQNEIDQAALASKGRAFIRPSGTEDLVRIFAEAPQELQCDRLALTVAQLVYDVFGGKGPHPEIAYHD